MAGPHPITGVMEKAFAIVGMLQSRRSITVYDVADELRISRSVAHKYLTAATTVLPVYVVNEKTYKQNQERMQYALLRRGAR